MQKWTHPKKTGVGDKDHPRVRPPVACEIGHRQRAAIFQDQIQNNQIIRAATQRFDRRVLAGNKIHTQTLAQKVTFP
ncbi:MAG: hypothetical protein JJ897_01650 [Marinibacterium sp.]|nr:hypothetical protein [Marinibacterium sp.]